MKKEMSRLRLGAGIAMAAASTIVLALTSTGPAQAGQQATRYIAFVDYYSDATYTQLVGSYTWNNCPGEEGHWGWGAQTSYHITTSEECP